MNSKGTISVAVSLLALLTTGFALTAGSGGSSSAPPSGEAQTESDSAQSEGDSAQEAQPAAPQWLDMFDGKTLEPWKVTNYGGEGEVTVKDGGIFLDYGADLTGVHRDWPLENENYELELEAMKVEGNDFFVGLTFPIGDGFASLILGGWGGGVCGLSSIDGYDASENETTDYRAFKAGVWTKVRVRVTEKQVIVWLDEEEYLVVDREDKKFDVRFEVQASKPFGLCAFITQSIYRNIRARRLTDADIKPADAAD